MVDSAPRGPAAGADGSGPRDALSETRDPLEREVHLLAERFRRMPESRLARRLPPYRSRAEAGHRMAQSLADAAHGVAARHAPTPPVWRTVPKLSPLAVGDQIAVTGYELLTVLDEPADLAGEAWTRDGRRPIPEVVGAIHDALRRLRLAL